MIKLSANVSKKMPVPGVQFSSQTYSAGMEVEVSSGTAGGELKEKLHALYSLLEESVEEQVTKVNGSAQTENSRPSEPAQSRASRSDDGNSGNGREATKAQIRAIHAIAKEQGSTDEALKELVADRFGVETASALSIGQASSLIDTLKNNGKE